MRKLILFLTFPAILAAKVNISPANSPVVLSGGLLRLKANVPVTWSLVPGSAGSIDADGTYHAPPGIIAKNVAGGCQILGNDHVFNTRVDALPVDANSAAWMALIPPGSALGYYPGWGLNFADHTTPKKPMHFGYTPGNDGQFETISWPALKRESGVFSDPFSNVDRHVVTIDRDTCDVFELYNDYLPNTQPTCPTCTAQSGIHYRGMETALPNGSVDAAGMPLTPLTLRLDEVHSGVIQHALRVTFSNSIIARKPTWPARANAGAWGKIPYGTRFRLKANFDISHFSKYGQVLLTQLKQYGLIIADGGGNFDISALTDFTLDPDAEWAFGEVRQKGPRTNDFEIVDESSLISSPLSGQVRADNGFVMPDGYAEVVASAVNNPNDKARLRIVLQGVTVGVPDPAKWIQSGVSTHLFAWVNGTADKRLRWSMNPALGSLTPSGDYTAPAVDHPTHTYLTVTSEASPKAYAKVDMVVLPTGPIRIVVGNATRAAGAPNKSFPDYGPDSEGHMWWRGQAGEVSWGVVVDDPGEPWPKFKDVQLFYTSRYSLGDMNYSFLVPNGRYKITLMFAQPNCRGMFPKAFRIPFHIETQGKLAIPNFDMGAGINYSCATPVVQSVPAVVTDNTLYFNLRRVTIKDYTPSPLLNAFSIARDSDPPHLSIAPEKVDTLTMNQKIQFKSIGWGLGEKATWSLVEGPGSITPEGVYTAPPAPPPSDQKIVIQAKSLSDPGKTARAEMYFKFGNLALSPDTATVARSLTQQFSASIDHINYANLKWSISPPVGSIAADGTYTAPDTLAHDTTVKVVAESKDVPGKTAAATLNVKAKPDPIRIDCGGGGFKDAQGNVWSGDHGFSKDTMSYHSNVKIAGTTPDMYGLYNSSRYRYTDASFFYNFAVPNGRYAVTLKFADYTYDSAGHYDFDVALNGRKVLSDFDPDAASGSKTAVDKKFEVDVTNKNLRIDLIGHKGGALINGIEIIPLRG